MARIDKVTGLFKLDPGEEKEIQDRLRQGEAIKQGMKELEKAGVDFGDLKPALESTLRLGKQLLRLAGTVKKSSE